MHARTRPRRKVQRKVRGGQVAEAEAWSTGRGIDMHLALAAALEFEAAEGRWPALHSTADTARLLELAEACSAENKASEVEGAVWAQKMEWGFPSGDARPVDAGVIGRFGRFYGAELTGFCAFLGGAVAQEVVKKTGMFSEETLNTLRQVCGL